MLITINFSDATLRLSCPGSLTPYPVVITILLIFSVMVVPGYLILRFAGPMGNKFPMLQCDFLLASIFIMIVSISKYSYTIQIKKYFHN